MVTIGYDYLLIPSHIFCPVNSHFFFMLLVPCALGNQQSTFFLSSTWACYPFKSLRMFYSLLRRKFFTDYVYVSLRLMCHAPSIGHNLSDFVEGLLDMVHKWKAVFNSSGQTTVEMNPQPTGFMMYHLSTDFISHYNIILQRVTCDVDINLLHVVNYNFWDNIFNI